MENNFDEDETLTTPKISKITKKELQSGQEDKLVDEFMKKLFSITRKDNNNE